MESELTIPLPAPIKMGEHEYTELKLSEPTVGELRKAGKAGDGLDQLATLMHLNGKLPLSIVDQMPQSVMEAAADFFGRFGKPSPTTSAT